MAGSCNSNLNNVCVACGPVVSIYGLEQIATLGSVGFDCDGKKYSRKKEAQSFVSQGRLIDYDANQQGNGAASYNKNSNFSISVDKYGYIHTFTEYKETYSSSMNGTSNIYATNSNANGNISVTYNLKSCPPEYETDSSCSAFGTYKYLPNGPTEVYNSADPADCGIPAQINNITWTQPDYICSYGEPTSNESIDRTLIQKNTTSCAYTENRSVAAETLYLSDPETFERIRAYSIQNCNSSDSLLISSQIKKSNRFSYCKISAPTKLSILENNGPQDCLETVCGGLQPGDEGYPGKKDDCWEVLNSFTVNSTGLDSENEEETVNYQEIAIVITADNVNNDFNRNYKKISGKIFLYYGGEVGETPCCTDCGGPECFTGTIVDNVSYTISNGNMFKENLVSSRIARFNNQSLSAHAGQTVNICASIEIVEYII